MPCGRNRPHVGLAPFGMANGDWRMENDLAHFGEWRLENGLNGEGKWRLNLVQKLQTVQSY